MKELPLDLDGLVALLHPPSVDGAFERRETPWLLAFTRRAAL
jgi:hypothetical protein